MNNETIYTITGVTGQLRGKGTIFGDTRPFGWFTSFEKAEEAILTNSCDINEAGYYKFFVIEAVTEGIHVRAKSEVWYEWDYDKEKYYKIDKPEIFGHIIGWSLG